MLKGLITLGLLFLLCASFAQAGVVRHVVKPVVTKSAHATAKVAKTAAHATKAIVY